MADLTEEVVGVGRDSKALWRKGSWREAFEGADDEECEGGQ